jgi:hypothetical protein
MVRRRRARRCHGPRRRPVARHRTPLTLYTTEQQAQQDCPTDSVVWLNTPSGIYHLKGQRYYGNTKTGAYVSRAEADAAGDRVDRSGLAWACL